MEPTPLPLLVNDREAAALCGLSRATWQRLMVRGLIPQSVKLGRRRLWSREEIEAWVAKGCPARETWEAIKTAAKRRLRAI